MPKRSPDGSRPYVEAFPSLNALTVERMVKAGRVLCEWVDELGRVFGHIRVRAFDEEMIFDLRFTDAGGRLPSRGLRSVEIIRRQHLGSHKRPFFLCKGCGLLASNIHCVWEQWKCRNCHHLCFHSQRAKAWVRNSLRSEYLRTRLDRGLESFENKREFTRARKEHGELQQELVNYGGGVIPPGVRSVLYPEWLSERRRPGLVWDTLDEPSSVPALLPEPPAPEPAPALPKPRSSIRYIVPVTGDDEEDLANDGYGSSPFWPPDG